MCIRLAILLVTTLICPAPAQTRPATQPADFRQLKDLLPDAIGGLRQTSADGATTSAGGDAAGVTSASADYSGAEDRADAPQIRVQIVDYAAAPQIAAGIAAAHERKLDLRGHPAGEQYDPQSKSGELVIFVADRFIVTVSTTNVPAEQIVKLGESLPLDELAALK